MEQIDRRLTHWGEAAFYFSLDLSGPIFETLFPQGTDLRRVRDVFRQSILQNREAVTAGKGSYYFKDLVSWNAKDERWVPLIAEFVQTVLVSKSYPEHRQNIPEAFLRDDDANDRMTEVLSSNSEGKSFRQLYHTALSVNGYDALFTAVIDVDAALETSQLSSWDGETLTRNREIYGLTDPLRSLISTADLMLRKQAINQVLTEFQGCSLADLLTMEASL